MNFIEELTWRGMIHDIMPETAELLKKEKVTGYVGFDPSSDSLHVGSLMPVMLLSHFQRCGHKPIILIGGATGMIGDPSGKSEERNLLNEELLRHYQECIKLQLEKFLDYESGENAAVIVNNYDWMKAYNFLDFIRDIGKHITVNYMTAKDSVKNRLETGMSFTEFSYQLVQAYDFYELHKNYNCKLQMGGSDQWGNITTGTELIRRKDGKKAYALTCPLVMKSDGGKFGKSEEGNIWLDAEKTSPYKFYQFWINASDEDVSKYIRYFTLLEKDEVEEKVKTHIEAPHLRVMQKALAEELTIKVHSKEELEKAKEASNILFGKSTKENLKRLSEREILEVFEGVPMHKTGKSVVQNCSGAIEFLTDETGILPSKGEAKRALKENSISLNKEKINAEFSISDSDLLNGKYLIVQRGKKNYYLVIVE